MSKNYNKIMSKVILSDDMHHRIMNNIGEYNFKTNTKIFILHKHTQFISLVACIAVLIVGAYTITTFNKYNTENNKNVLNTTSDIVDASSTKELSQLVGFQVKTLSYLPFDVIDTTYTSYWKEFSQIEYLGSTETATFRTALGNQDISGDYNTYSSMEQLTIGENVITLKGTNDLYNLAIWNDSTYSYSIQLSNGTSINTWIAIINSIV